MFARRITRLPLTRFNVPRRGNHTIRALNYDVEGGLGDFLSPEALKVIAVDYQGGLLERLNQQVKDTPLAGQSVVQTVIQAAQSREHILAFNYASQALNNSFFLDCLRPPPPSSPNAPPNQKPSHPIPANLLSRINHSFESLDSLKDTVRAAANGMMGSGWIWLVSDQRGELAVLPTFGAGTMLVRSRMQSGPQQDQVLGEEFIPSTSGKRTARPAPGQVRPGTTPTQQRTFSSTAVTSDSAYQNYFAMERGASPLESDSPLGFSVPETSSFVHDMSYVGQELSPLFVLSLHEHAWMAGGYGVWGKDEYLERFWSVLDWAKVAEHLEKFHSHANWEKKVSRNPLESRGTLL